MADATDADLIRWLEAEVLLDKGGQTPDADFAGIADWGAKVEEAEAEAQIIARKLGIEAPPKPQTARAPRCDRGAFSAWEIGTVRHKRLRSGGPG